jgi:hypothetical protein
MPLIITMPFHAIDIDAFAIDISLFITLMITPLLITPFDYCHYAITPLIAIIDIIDTLLMPLITPLMPLLIIFALRHYFHYIDYLLHIISISHY